MLCKKIIDDQLQILYESTEQSSEAPKGAHVAYGTDGAVPCDAQVVFQELFVTPWHDFWWRQVLSFWNAMRERERISLVHSASIGL